VSTLLFVFGDHHHVDGIGNTRPNPISIFFGEDTVDKRNMYESFSYQMTQKPVKFHLSRLWCTYLWKLQNIEKSEENKTID